MGEVLLETSIYLARVIGLLSVISALAVIVHYKKFLTLESDAIKNPLYIFLSGFIFLVLGVLLVVGHSVWVADWRLVVTLLSWSVLLKGVGRIFFPDAIKYVIEKKKKNRSFILGEIVLIGIGLYLLYHGFMG